MSVYATREYAFGMGIHNNTHFDITYNKGVFVGTYISYSDPSTETYPPLRQVR